MKTASMADVQARLGTFVTECAKGGPLVITNKGKPVAVLVTPVDPDDLERLLLARSTQFQKKIRQSTRSIKSGRGLTHSEFWSEVQAAATTSKTKIKRK